MVENFRKIPAQMIAGSKDYLVAPQDFDRLQKTLGYENNSYFSVPDYNHLDLIWGRSINTHVFDTVISFIQEHTVTDSQ